ncbi:U11/U12 small nuclear ribonucleoprotein 59 kDa protein isoform X2 [Apium graveolens]|uniref:U11/U12 small nuclear ribonucleoprotein 59 kDa protein isoform X2 n=1 Tax=Apium graveolens TaxID=4045 RepID=UPI003D7A913D
MMNPINSFPPSRLPAPPQQFFPAFPPFPPPSSNFWETNNVKNRLTELKDTVRIAKAMQCELELLIAMKEKGDDEGKDSETTKSPVSAFSDFLKENMIDLDTQELRSLEGANALISKLSAEVQPFRVLTDDTSQWEEKSVAMRFANKIQKHKRNKLWRKRKRKRVAEMVAKERERFDQANQEADEWRAREIAKDIAKRKVEKMKEIAKIKAKEERRKLESELELVLTVEKLQELRSIRIQKLKKQGHFLPEEDDKFIEKVRAAVEEEERQAKAAAAASAAKDAIATAEESRKVSESHGQPAEDPSSRHEDKESQDQIIKSENAKSSKVTVDTGKQGSEGPGPGRAYDSLANLPLEFYHYYHGSNTDMGTLIEVRRSWDAYIRPGGSRIPGHWVQPPPPADEIWASYLVKPK